ncbi:RNA polymerase sigma-70 factor, ECF subfamily [Sinomicrobium oceani]|uniref:RNA polymerase sigma factor n=1 Tax=Sinomicrobium oceani TaxID=1150368 RepID=A0A1K1LRJ1_9FLAO|nr:sigma-70 family RNA polymerase sigma factor [Sinomicrobium oceani]SFW13456.1 RNA polymerase sigma-70 factor, ECF subfamily [Sinomicrobium oceani]
MTDHKDDYYIRQVLEGKTEAFAFLVEKYKDMVFTLSIKMLKDREEAEEITQDVFMISYRSLREFRGDSRFSTWLYRIAYNKCLDVLKRKGRYVIVDYPDRLTGVPHEALNALQQIVEKDRNEAVRQAVKLLPEDDRVLVWMYYFDEMSIKEIAKVVNLSEANIKIKLFRSRKILYRLLENNKLIRE